MSDFLHTTTHTVTADGYAGRTNYYPVGLNNINTFVVDVVSGGATKCWIKPRLGGGEFESQLTSVDGYTYVDAYNGPVVFDVRKYDESALYCYDVDISSTVVYTGYEKSTVNIGVSGAAGAVQFSSGTGVLSSDGSNFHWDDTNDRLGVGTDNPAETLDVRGNLVVSGDIQNTQLQNTLDGYGRLTADGGDGYIAFFTGANSIAGDNDLFYNRATGDVTIGSGGSLSVAQVKNSAGVLNLGTSASTSHSLSADADVIVGGKLEVNGDSYFDGNVSLGSNYLYLDNYGDTYIKEITGNVIGFYAGGAQIMTAYASAVAITRNIMMSNSYRIYNSNSALNLGDSASTSHGLGTGDVLVGDKFEVDGLSYFDDDVTVGSKLEVDGYTYLDGGLAINRTATAVDRYVTGSENIIAVTSSGVDRNIYLPDATSFSAGHTFYVKDEGGGAGANNITVLPADGGQTIDGAASITISTNYGSVRVYTNGTNWFTL